MKKKLILSLIVLFGTFAAGSLFAQESPKELRQEKRAEAEAQAFNQIAEIVKGKSFAFTPSRIVSTLNPDLLGVSISPTYGVWVSPYQFKAYLPVFGPDPYSGQATLLRTMDFFNQTYQYSYEQQKDAFIVTINVTDNWSATNYSFVFNITPSNNYSTLSISTAFSSNIVFQGTIVPYGNFEQ